MDMNSIIGMTGRTLIALLFVLAGLAKLVGSQPFLEHMAQFNVPGILLYGVIALELGAGLALLFGFQVRYAALALGVFCILTALVFHHDLGDKMERTLFLKDLAIAGGLFAVATAMANSST